MQSSSQIITTNKPAFYKPDALPDAQPTVSKQLREKVSYSMDLLTPGSSKLVFDQQRLPWRGVA